MKISIVTISSAILLLTISTVSGALAQQTFTQTVTAQNTSCNSHCTVIDLPALNGHPAAILFVTQATGNGTSPIGAYYMYQNKWSILNLNNAVMPVSAKFDIEYYAAADANHFAYIVPPKVHSDDVAYIDHAGLNNSPNSQVRLFPTNPSPINANFNPNAVHAAYDASISKWWIVQDLGGAVTPGVAYNIGFNVLTLLPPINTGTVVPLPTPTPGPTPAGGYIQNTTIQQPTSNFNISGSGTAARLVAGDVGIGINAPRDKLDVNGNIRVSTLGAAGATPLCRNAADQISTCASAVPAASPAPATSAQGVHAFFNKGTLASPVITNNSYFVTDLNHTIVLTKPSQLVISGSVEIDAEVDFGVIAMDGTNAILGLEINGVFVAEVQGSAPAGGNNTLTICNFVIDKPPGTYNIRFTVTNWVGHSFRTHAVSKQSTVIVIPQ